MPRTIGWANTFEKSTIRKRQAFFEDAKKATVINAEWWHTGWNQSGDKQGRFLREAAANMRFGRRKPRVSVRVTLS